jgi:hypothetical protein
VKVRIWLALGLVATFASPLLAQQPAPGGPPAPPVNQDSLQADRQKHVTSVREAIAGREEMPADSVFKNLRILNTLPAGRLLRIMEMGYSNSLGVSCDHCHVIGEWDKDDKNEKEVARDMAEMLQIINQDLIRKIPNIKSSNPSVNCGTCHRGTARPGANQRPAQGPPPTGSPPPSAPPASPAAPSR